ncbi:MAG TPA: hypothetical protein VG674_22595 [Amycolatopsis sp.]|nr:hypothetical protein [Amycolatopsis sp.]
MRDQITSEFLKSLAVPGPAPAGGTVAALAVAQAAALLARVGHGAPGGWMHGLRLAEQDALAARGGDAAVACGPPADVIASAEELLVVAEQQVAADRTEPGHRDRAEPGDEAALLDVVAAVEAVRFAVVTAGVAIETRLARLPEEERAGLFAVLDAVAGLVSRASMITEEVRTRAGAAVA